MPVNNFGMVIVPWFTENYGPLLILEYPLPHGLKRIMAVTVPGPVPEQGQNRAGTGQEQCQNRAIMVPLRQSAGAGHG